MQEKFYSSPEYYAFVHTNDVLYTDHLLKAIASPGMPRCAANRPSFMMLPNPHGTLQSNSPRSMRYVAMAQMGYVSSLDWSHGAHSLKTGEKTFDAVTGMAVWDHLAQHPEEAQVFSQSRNSIGTESIIPPGNEPSPAKFADVIMLLLTGGRERSEEEYRSLLRSNGFELTRLIPTPSMLSIIEAVKL